MSRVAKRPVVLAQGVEINLDGNALTVKGPRGDLSLECHSEVKVVSDDSGLAVSPRSGSRFARAMAGTTRALISNMVSGVSTGFERRLKLVGVGYRAKVQGQTVNLTLGFSHPVVYEVPDGITVETTSQTELLVKGIDKQKVGQVAAEIRNFRPPEPYKGKGVRYADERIVLKETKKS
ncbi:MAG: 50S ribosomal protein L6 [Gammaproteobacteria bacterium]|nr:MAG: 50S ribosomal protein L6 [Gammaproteobacteria bacterium]TDJ43934.1 MAG: 50S ribosomal protein L6 [Gammaproteobacteria bacterium]